MDIPTFRQATEGDVPALLAMMEAFYRSEGIDWQPAAVEGALGRLLNEDRLGTVPLMELAGRLAGYAVVTLGYDLEYHGHDAYLTELWVEPWARGRGMARRLLDEAERLMRAQGVRALHLGVRPENERAVALYGRAGYRPSPLTFLTKRLAR